MTEKEKQQAGELYNANDPELVAERVAAKKLCMEYNQITYNDYQKKERLLDRLVALRGENTWIDPDFYCDYGYNIIIGDNFYANHNCVILDCAEVVFGNDIFIGPNCGFYAAGHPIDFEVRNRGLEYAKPIKVGNNVWFGGNVCVLPGVTIGDNVVIGGGSVVVNDIPSGVVAVGNPCRPIRNIDERDKITIDAETPAEDTSKPENTEPPKPKGTKAVTETPKAEETAKAEKSPKANRTIGIKEVSVKGAVSNSQRLSSEKNEKKKHR